MVILGEADRRVLEAVVRRDRADHRRLRQARIVLAAANGETNVLMSRLLAIAEDTGWGVSHGRSGDQELYR